AAESLLGIPKPHLRQIYNAPDPRFSDDAASARRADRQLVLQRYQINYPYILYAGNIRPQKNIPRLIEAFAVLRGELAGHDEYSDLRLIIMGDEISQFPAVRLVANQSRAGNAIRF